MKIATHYTSWSPPQYEWAAYDDDTFPDGPVGTGATERAALEELLWMVDDQPEFAAAVEARLAQLVVAL